MVKSWFAFEHKIHRHLSAWNLRDQHLLLALSGGMDSMALLTCLTRLQEAHGYRLSLLHVHHGPGDNLQYRDSATEFCRKTAAEYGLSLEICKSIQPLKSEEEMRQFRLGALQDWAQKIGAAWLVFGHHADDQLETQILNLIRGSGLRGAQGMHDAEEGRLRPMLNVRKAEIIEYTQQLGIPYCEDPSNANSATSLRNWVRNDWLPALEKRSPGALQSLGRSLQQLAELSQSHEQELASFLLPDNSLDRLQLMGLSRSQQKSVIAQYLLRQGHRDITAGHLDEVLKLIDRNTAVFEGRIGNLQWHLNARQIRASSRV